MHDNSINSDKKCLKYSIRSQMLDFIFQNETEDKDIMLNVLAVAKESFDDLEVLIKTASENEEGKLGLGGEDLNKYFDGITRKEAKECADKYSGG